MLTRIVVAFFTVLNFAPASSRAQNACIGIENDLDRLSCYDEASGRKPRASTVTSHGEWILQEEVSKLTDEKNVALRLPSIDAVDCQWNAGKKAFLLLLCRDKTTSLVVNTGCHMTSNHGGYGEVDLRIGKQKATVVSMDASTDNKSLGVWTGGRSIPIIKQMFGEETLVMRMTPYGENPILIEFNIAGLEAAADPLRKACNW